MSSSGSGRVDALAEGEIHRRAQDLAREVERDLEDYLKISISAVQRQTATVHSEAQGKPPWYFLYEQISQDAHDSNKRYPHESMVWVVAIPRELKAAGGVGSTQHISAVLQHLQQIYYTLYEDNTDNQKLSETQLKDALSAAVRQVLVSLPVPVAAYPPQLILMEHTR